MRIVSLVPSITELICDLGLAAQLVGRTGFCVHPREVVRRIPKVGGTKDVDLDKLRALRATHVLLNLDENRDEDARAIAGFVPELIVTHPLAPLDNVASIRVYVHGKRVKLLLEPVLGHGTIVVRYADQPLLEHERRLFERMMRDDFGIVVVSTEKRRAS